RSARSSTATASSSAAVCSSLANGPGAISSRALLSCSSGQTASLFSIGSQGRGVREADPFPHPPFNPCVRFSRTRFTDDLLDMVTQPRGNEWCHEADGGRSRQQLLGPLIASSTARTAAHVSVT